jgi:hypothetical protein
MSRITALLIGIAVDRYLNDRESRGWLRSRLVLQWAAVRADG